jgi:hypothetical protein
MYMLLLVDYCYFQYLDVIDVFGISATFIVYMYTPFSHTSLHSHVERSSILHNKVKMFSSVTYKMSLSCLTFFYYLLEGNLEIMSM